MKTKLITTIMITLFLASMLGMLSMAFNVTLVSAITITETYISDDTGATLVMDDAIDPATGDPHYGPTDWESAVYAWGPPDGSGASWNDYLHPSDYKTELLGSGANWIWKPTDTPGQTLPDDRTVYKITDDEADTGDIVKFKRSFDIPFNAFNVEGTLLIATDNAFYLYVNGVFIAEGNFYDGYNHENFRNSTTGFPIEGSVELPDPGEPEYPWSVIHSIDISSELQIGTNTLEIVGINENALPPDPREGTPENNPSGVMYKLTVEHLNLYVDIKPGSCPNPINVVSRGVLPVAICGTEDFDVTTIDPTTIEITKEGLVGVVGVPPLRWGYRDVATPYTGEPCGCHALKGDGYLDLGFHFSTQEVVTKLGLVAHLGETIPLIITGNLYDGTPIQGQDCVRILVIIRGP